MRILKNIMVGFVGVLLVTFTVILTAATVYLVENPVVLNLECSPDLIQWHGENYACEIQFVEGAFDQMVLWRNAQDDLIG